MRTRLNRLLLVYGCIAFSTPAQQHEDSKPSLIDSTYQVTGFLGTDTIHLYEEDGQLTWGTKSRLKTKYRGSGPQETERSESVDYGSVNFVEYLPPVGPRESSVHITTSLRDFTVLLPKESSEGPALAEYVARKSPFGLELIGRAWRIRKAFQCPENSGLGCVDFKDLLDHGDPDIADYFYKHDPDTHTYACFRSDQQAFFVVQYGRFFGNSGFFQFQEFDNQQSGRTEYGEVQWRGEGAFITEAKLFLKPGVQPKAIGSMDLASLSYDTHYPNRQDTTTHYTLSVRWSTGRFTESYSAKNKKGESVNFDKTGVCSKLN